ncbi:CPBP family intramembrane metalloprotease domain-containing protein [Brachybacterium avium]|uniref:CPBP family intramembrane metalloprotease domain-containing protein n=2 Tax=Brachybacterium avium TaxID=2017485 RepID=A0A220UAR5_9MICO|nr:CPBP family intramembrane metalloprotease domain-containing protein [Brachybacterium avium]
MVEIPGDRVDPGHREADGECMTSSQTSLHGPRTPVPAERRRVRWRSVLVFGAVAYGLFALCAAPFWVLDEGITHPLYTLVIGAGMFAPTIASVVVAKLVDRTSWRDAVGLRFRGRWKRILLWAPLATLLVLALNLATAVIMVLRGVPGDLTGSTWAAEVSRSMSEQGAEMPTGAAVALVLAISAFGLLLTVVPALGEEIGWRGWLRRELAPLGPWPAIVLGGAIWSLWHLPVTLIGHNYTGQPRWAAVAMFLPASIALHYLFSAITERAGGNPIPAAFAHATLNSTLGVAIGVVATSETASELNWFLDTPMGLTGIVLIAATAFAIMPRTGRGAGRGDQQRTAPEAG